MAGSAAEERIREKAVAALRRREPRARIIHELVLQQGGVRMDLAAVWPSGMILVEIKSERDTLTRLQSQMQAATRLRAETWLCLAEKWRPAIEVLKTRTINERWVPLIMRGQEVGSTRRSDPAPGYMSELERVEVRFEIEAGFEPLRMGAAWYLRDRRFDPYALLDMLWADELRRLTGLGGRRTRSECIEHAALSLTGKEVRERVFASLRAREFPCADPAVEWVSDGGVFGAAG